MMEHFKDFEPFKKRGLWSEKHFSGFRYKTETENEIHRFWAIWKKNINAITRQNPHSRAFWRMVPSVCKLPFH